MFSVILLFGSLLDDENWWIVRPSGDRIGIFIPAIDLADSSIDWRER